MKLHRFPVVILAAVAAASFVACDDSDSTPTTDTPDAIGDVPADNGGDNGTDNGGEVPPPAKARLRAIHLSPDAPAVDIFANGGTTAAVTNLAFPAGTGYLELDPGTYDFDIAPAGAGIGSKVLSVNDLALASDKSYTAVAYDNVASLKALALEDDYEGLAAGNIRVRAVHAAAGVGQVDIWAIPATGNPVPLIQDLDFGAAADKLDVPAGSYKLGIDVDNDASPDVVFTTPELAAGTVANVFAVQQGGKVFLIAQLNDGTTARIDADMAPVAKARLRAIHLSPDAPAVDIFANGGMTAAVTDLAFPAGTGYLELDPGTYDFDIAPAGAGIGSKVLSVNDLALESGKSYTAVAYDNVASLKALALEDDYAGLAAGNLRVRAVHAAAGVGQVDIWAIPEAGTAVPLIQDLDFGAASSKIDVPAGSYKLGIDVDNDANPDLTFTTPALPAGTVANVFAVQQGGKVFLIAQLNDGTTARIDADVPPVPARIRVLHLSPDAPAVDVFMNDASPAVVTNLAFPSGTGYLDVVAGQYNFDIAPADAGLGASVLDTGALDLAAGTSYTAVAYDAVASLKVMALVDDYAGLAEGNIRVRAIHAAAGVGQVDIWNIPAMGDPTPLYTDVDFGAVGAYADLPAGAYTLGFDVNNDGTPDLAFQTPSLPAGTVANVFAVKQDAAVFLIAELNDGTTARIDPMPK